MNIFVLFTPFSNSHIPIIVENSKKKKPLSTTRQSIPSFPENKTFYDFNGRFEYFNNNSIYYILYIYIFIYY